MRILVVSNYYPPYVMGGAEISAANQVALLHQAGHELRVWTRAVTPLPEEAPSQDTVPVRRIKRPYPYEDYRSREVGAVQKLKWHAQDMRGDFTTEKAALLQELAEFNPDLIFVHNLQGLGYRILELIAENPRPVLWMVHDLALACYRTSMFKGDQACESLCLPCRLTRPWKQAAFQRLPAFAVVAPSADMLGRIRPHVPRNCVWQTTTPHALTFDPPTQVIARRGAGIQLLFVGQISPQKGVAFLLEMLAKLHPHHAFHLHVLGRGPSLGELEGKYRDADWVDFVGFVDQATVSAYMAMADCLLVPSLWAENSPLVVYHARQEGRPVLMSDRGGMVELIEQDLNGWALPCGDPAAWQSALERLLTEPAELARLQAGAQASKNAFAPETLLAKLVETMEATIEACQAAPVRAQ